MGQREYAIARHYGALGEYLQEMRVKANLTQRTVSEVLGYSSAQFISNFERGICSPPFTKLKTLISLYKMPKEKVMDLVIQGERELMTEALVGSPSKRRRSTGR